MRYLRWSLPILLLVGLLVALFPSLLVAGSERRALIADDLKSVRVTGGAGDEDLEYTIAEWQAWAEANLTEVLGGPVRIGPQEMSPSTFALFGATAIGPNSDVMALSAQTYAMLTTVSVVGVLDLSSRTFSAVGDTATGGVEEFHWSPDGEFIAYPLGTARAEGDRLRVDDVGELRPAVELEGEDLVAAARHQGLEVTADPRQWIPQIRDLDWSDGGRLLFTTNGFEGGELRWGVDPDTGTPTID